jgi:hypothetical protein
MKRLVALAGALVLGLGILVPSALAAAPMAHTGRVLISTQGDVTVAAGEQADVVVVVQGHADIQGDVNTLVVVDGTATLTGAELETIVAVRGTIEVADGTVIYGELQRLDSTVHQSGNVQIQGGITDISGWFVEASAVLAPALFLLWIGFGLSTIVAALFLAALATRQVRAAEQLISRDPFVTFLVGLLSVIAIPVGAVLLLVTVVGAPLGFGVLFAVLPLLAYAGYLVAAIWLGEWLLRRSGPRSEVERPFLAAVIGVVILGLVGLVPIVGLISTIASLLGFGALIRLGYRALRGTPQPSVGAPMPAPSASSA